MEGVIVRRTAVLLLLASAASASFAKAPEARADTSPREAGFHPRRIGLLRTIAPKMTGLFDCAFSPDGRRLALAGQDGSVRLFSTATWKEERMVVHHEGMAYT